MYTCVQNKSETREQEQTINHTKEKIKDKKPNDAKKYRGGDPKFLHFLSTLIVTSISDLHIMIRLGQLNH